jgi:hypothetical protein
MSIAPYTDLQATPDFTTFQFTSPTLPEPCIRQLRFNGHQGGRIYHVELRSKPTDKKDDPSWQNSKDFLCVALTTIQIIEIYSERYPRRILRFSGDTTQKALVFGTILVRFHHLLAPLFQIEAESPGPNSSVGKERSCPFSGGPGGYERCNAPTGSPGGKDRSYAFLIKRKPFPYFSVHTIESTWNGTSRIFNNRFSIGLDKRVQIGLTLPAV